MSLCSGVTFLLRQYYFYLKLFNHHSLDLFQVQCLAHDRYLLNIFELNKR